MHGMTQHTECLEQGALGAIGWPDDPADSLLPLHDQHVVARLEASVRIEVERTEESLRRQTGKGSGIRSGRAYVAHSIRCTSGDSRASD